MLSSTWVQEINKSARSLKLRVRLHEWCSCRICLKMPMISGAVCLSACLLFSFSLFLFLFLFSFSLQTCASWAMAKPAHELASCLAENERLLNTSHTERTFSRSDPIRSAPFLHFHYQSSISYLNRSASGTLISSISITEPHHAFASPLLQSIQHSSLSLFSNANRLMFWYNDSLIQTQSKLIHCYHNAFNLFSRLDALSLIYWTRCLSSAIVTIAAATSTSSISEIISIR